MSFLCVTHLYNEITLRVCHYTEKWFHLLYFIHTHGKYSVIIWDNTLYGHHWTALVVSICLEDENWLLFFIYKRVREKGKSTVRTDSQVVTQAVTQALIKWILKERYPIVPTGKKIIKTKILNNSLQTTKLKLISC